MYRNFNFTLPSSASPSAEGAEPVQQFWAVVGPSQRTDLLNILRGQHISIPPNARSYPYLLTDELAAKDPRLRVVENAVQYIGFTGEGSGAIGGTRGAYLSARYESYREETDWTVEQFLRGQTSLNPMEGEEKGTLHDEQLLQQVITDLHLTELLDMPVANLSNGQTRRARIAKALLRKPELLLLDEPFMGLDPATVRGLSDLLFRLAQKSSPRLVLALRPQDAVPQWITHMIIVGNCHQITQQGLRSEIAPKLEVWKRLAVNIKTRSLVGSEHEIAQEARRLLKSGILDEQLLQDFSSDQSQTRARFHHASLGGEPLIEMDGVRVQYGDNAVLGDWKQNVDNEAKDGLHWTVRRGQRWAILGANGSGKTTLLSLITSDHPQAYALPIKLFGRSRLPEVGKPGISIFELQSRMGHSSPEIHAFFPRQLTVRESIESAFAETFLSKPKLTHQNDMDVDSFLRFFKAELDPNQSSEAQNEKGPRHADVLKNFPKLPGVSHHTPFFPHGYDVEYADNVRFGQLSTAQQRIVLFLRALVHKPDIVILDEAFSGLTAAQRDKCLAFLEHGEALAKIPKRRRRFHGLSKDQALIMISHVKEEIPDCVRYYMRLPSGTKDDPERLDFRFGILKASSYLNDPKVWDAVWAPGSRFELNARRSWRRNVESLEQDDMTRYEWYSL
jgi:ABC-type molybdenum transport system ATPase subunit/photorepair protein PhrA